MVRNALGFDHQDGQMAGAKSRYQDALGGSAGFWRRTAVQTEFSS
jgi:hypothetical protein